MDLRFGGVLIQQWNIKTTVAKIMNDIDLKGARG